MENAKALTVSLAKALMLSASIFATVFIGSMVLSKTLEYFAQQSVPATGKPADQGAGF